MKLINIDKMNIAITDEVLLKNGFLYKNPENFHLSSLYKCGERNEWGIMIENGYDSKNQFGYTNCSCWVCDEDSNAIKRRTSISESVKTIEEITAIVKICGIDIDFKD